MRPSLRTALPIVAVGGACALLLALPGRTVTTAYVNDLLIFLDGAHRLAWGQVPNVDFHTALGPLVYLLPAAGLALGGQLGAAMPVGMALLILTMLPVMVHVIGSRLRPMLGLPLAVFLLLVLAVPANLGAPVSGLSFAMFYNRIGWAAFALLLVMVLPPVTAGRRQLWLDAGCAAALVLLQAYTKSTYGVVALAFVIFMLFDRPQWRWAALSLLMTATAALLIELVWGGSRAHLRDVVETAQVSGDRSLEAIIRGGLNNLPDIVIFAIAAGLAVWLTRSLRLAIYFLACLVTGMMILSQNAHGWGIINLFAAAVVGIELVQRSQVGRAGWRLSSRLAAGAPMLLVPMLLPPILWHGAGLALHFGLALSNFGQPLPLPAFQEVWFGRPWTPDKEGYAERYIAGFAEGAAALSQLGTPIERIVVLDFITPFSAGLGIEPPRGDSSWLHWGRNVDEETHLSGEQLLGDAKFVMVPHIGINSPPLAELYRPYVEQHFTPVGTAEHWDIYLRNERPGAGEDVAKPGLAAGPS